MIERYGIRICQWTAVFTCVSFLAALQGCGRNPPQPNSTSRVSEIIYTPAMESKEKITKKRSEVPQTPTFAETRPSTAPSSPSLSTLAGAQYTSIPQQRFRLADDRPKLNREELLAHGLRMVESRHLLLVTDLPEESVADLPPLADALFTALEQRLGKLAPNIAGAEFQVTGFLMDARDRFDRAGVLPPEEYPIRHGRHLGYQFWMNNQPADYYRRHLLLHEFVHCFLMCEYGMNDIPALWYTEGIAEYFATHRLHAEVAQSEFGILPTTEKGFDGWHRIAEVRRHFDKEPSATGELSNIISLQTVLHPPDTVFLADSKYANAWALVWLINHHPELRLEFAGLAHCRTQQQFNDAMSKISPATLLLMNQIWPLYLDGLEEASETTVRFPLKEPLTPLKTAIANSQNALPMELRLEADKQWVSTGLELTAGEEISIQCKDQYVVGKTTKPWNSEPDGITIDYVHGCPLGQVIGAIVSNDGAESTRRIPIGASKTLRSPIDGILWLQINDRWSDRAENAGSVVVQIAAKKTPGD